MSRFTGFSEKPFISKKKDIENIGKVDAIALNFSKELERRVQ